MTRRVVLSDLDGTLLDQGTASMELARPALNRLKETGTPLVLVSSRTRVDIEGIRADLGIQAPFVVENGGALFFPPECGLEPERNVVDLFGYRAVVLGSPTEEIVQKMEPLAGRFRLRFPGRSSTSPDSAAMDHPGLDPVGLEMAAGAAREFGLMVILDEAPARETRLAAEISELGLRLLRFQGRHLILGANDQGRAAQILIEVYRKRWPRVVFAAIGDATSDEPLLAAVDYAYLVAQPDLGHAPVYLPRLTRVSKPGPAGFNQAVLSLLDNAAVT
jgi:mannosyl-3-phosphoglycerate phosphatase